MSIIGYWLLELLLNNQPNVLDTDEHGWTRIYVYFKEKMYRLNK